MDTNIEKDCLILEEFFQQIVGDMKNSFPIWEDFTAKAGRLQVALRTTAVCTSAFLESFQKLADMALGTRGSTREIGSALTRLCLRHRSIDSKLKTFTSAIADRLVVPLQDRMDEWKRTVAALDREHTRENKKIHQELRRVSSDVTRLQKKARKGKTETGEQLEQAIREVNDRAVVLREFERQSVRTALIEQRSRLCQFVCGLKPVMDEELSILSEMTHVQEIVHSLCMVANEPESLPAATEHLVIDMLSPSDTTQSQIGSAQTPGSPGSAESRLSNAGSCGSVIVTGNQSPTHPFNRSLSMPNPNPVMYSTTVPIDCSTHGSSDSEQLDAEDSTTTLKPAAESSSGSEWLDMNVTSNTRFSATLPASYEHRPHTISSAYERTGHTRPALSADTFSPLQSTMVSRSRPPSVHGTMNLGNSSASPYAVPCIAPPSRRRDTSAGGAKVADIYARPSLVGSRSSAVRPLPVATPTVPDYMSTGLLQSPPSGAPTSCAPSFPVAGYVNMNQLAHLALQQQGLCTSDKGDQDPANNQTTPTSEYHPGEHRDESDEQQKHYHQPQQHHQHHQSRSSHHYSTDSNTPACDITSMYTTKMNLGTHLPYSESSGYSGGSISRAFSVPEDRSSCPGSDDRHNVHLYRGHDCDSPVL